MSVEKNKIIKALIDSESTEELTCGDIWVEIELDGYMHGAFVQVELKELDNGEYSNDVYCIYGYENTGTDVEGFVTTDYSDTILYYEVNKKEFS